MTSLCSSESASLAAIAPSFASGAFEYGTGEILSVVTEGTGPLLVSPVSGTTAVGFDFGGGAIRGNAPSTFTFMVTDANGQIFSFDKIGGTPAGRGGGGFAFIGFLSDSPIVSILSTPSNLSGFTNYDNFRSKYYRRGGF